MGKTHQPLRIVVLPPLTEAKWVQELEEKGHSVTRISDTEGMITLQGVILTEAHLILGPNCHFFHPAMRIKDVEESLKWVRRQVYPSKEKKPKGVKKNGEAS